MSKSCLIFATGKYLAPKITVICETLLSVYILFIVNLSVLKALLLLIKDFQSCGNRFLRPQTKRYGRAWTRSHVISKRIVGGSVSNDRAWPWQAALLLDNTQVCGGSLIRSNWILTACHCFTGASMNTSLYLNLFFFHQEVAYLQVLSELCIVLQRQ